MALSARPTQQPEYSRDPPPQLPPRETPADVAHRLGYLVPWDEDLARFLNDWVPKAPLWLCRPDERDRDGDPIYVDVEQQLVGYSEPPMIRERKDVKRRIRRFFEEL